MASCLQETTKIVKTCQHYITGVLASTCMLIDLSMNTHTCQQYLQTTIQFILGATHCPALHELGVALYIKLEHRTTPNLCDTGVSNQFDNGNACVRNPIGKKQIIIIEVLKPSTMFYESQSIVISFQQDCMSERVCSQGVSSLAEFIMTCPKLKAPKLISSIC